MSTSPACFINPARSVLNTTSLRFIQGSLPRWHHPVRPDDSCDVRRRSRADDECLGNATATFLASSWQTPRRGIRAHRVTRRLRSVAAGIAVPALDVGAVKNDADRTSRTTRDGHGHAWSGTPRSRCLRKILSSPIRRSLASQWQSRRGTRIAPTRPVAAGIAARRLACSLNPHMNGQEHRKDSPTTGISSLFSRA